MCIEFYRVQDFSITSSSNGLCYVCSFITRNYTQGCFIVYNSTRTIFNGHFNITVSEQQQCVEDIYTSVYNITVYDIESDGTVRMDQPVFKINDVSVTGIPYTDPSPSDMIYTSTTTATTTTTTTKSSSNSEYSD